jgi:hypothetical protein
MQLSCWNALRYNVEAYTRQGKQLFIKDIAYYLFPPNGQPGKIVPSLNTIKDETKTPNPTVIPVATLGQFTFTFLIRHPRRAIPSYYRCTVPPLDKVTGFSHFMPSEAGYDELRRLFDFLAETGIVGRGDVVVLDADDMLDDPETAIRLYCEGVGIEYRKEMLKWDEEDAELASNAFEKWNGFHNDAIGSSCLKPRTHAHVSPGRYTRPLGSCIEGICELTYLT